MCLTNDPAPRASPLLPSNGLTLNPSDGNYMRSLKPEPILWAKESGLPKIARFPIIGKITLEIPS